MSLLDAFDFEIRLPSPAVPVPPPKPPYLRLRLELQLQSLLASSKALSVIRQLDPKMRKLTFQSLIPKQSLLYWGPSLTL